MLMTERTLLSSDTYIDVVCDRMKKYLRFFHDWLKDKKLILLIKKKTRTHVHHFHNMD